MSREDRKSGLRARFCFRDKLVGTIISTVIGKKAILRHTHVNFECGECLEEVHKFHRGRVEKSPLVVDLDFMLLYGYFLVVSLTILCSFGHY
jgi:hypothetical protein